LGKGSVTSPCLNLLIVGEGGRRKAARTIITDAKGMVGIFPGGSRLGGGRDRPYGILKRRVVTEFTRGKSKRQEERIIWRSFRIGI